MSAPITVRTFAVLHAVDLETDHVVELERVEIRGGVLFNPDAPILFAGQVYVPAPLHLRRTARPMVNTAEELELPFHLVEVYDVDLDGIAPRLYAPDEANELVERVREPLDQLVKAVEGVDIEKLEDQRAVAAALRPAQALLLELAPPEPCLQGNGPSDEETPCPAREDGTHCVHWWEGDHPCCDCGDNSQSSAETGQ